MAESAARSGWSDWLNELCCPFSSFWVNSSAVERSTAEKFPQEKLQQLSNGHQFNSGFALRIHFLLLRNGNADGQTAAGDWTDQTSTNVRANATSKAVPGLGPVSLAEAQTMDCAACVIELPAELWT